MIGGGRESKNMHHPHQNARRSRPKAAYRENGQNPKILASQDSNDATEEAMGHG
jgi:hypothetical protein